MTDRMQGAWAGSVAATLLAALLAPASAGAQSRSDAAFPVVVGSRVRLAVAPSASESVVGTLMGLDETSLLVGTNDNRPVRVRRDAVTRLEVSTGRRGNVLRGLLIGAASGAALFAIYPREEYCRGLLPGETCPSRGDMIGIGVAGGAGIGALVGHLIKHDHWAEIPLAPARLSVAPAPGRGAQLRMAVSW